MAGRLKLTVLILVGCLTPQWLYAQGMSDPAGMPPAPYGYAPNAVFGQPAMGPGAIAAPGYPANGMMPAAWTDGPNGPVAPPVDGGNPPLPPGCETCQNGLTYFDPSLLRDEEFDPKCHWPFHCCCNDTAKALFTDLVTESWVRVEYLFWDITDPTATLLGAPLASVPNPEEDFAVTGGTARVPTLAGTQLNDNSGVRITTGIPLDPGTLEFSGFLLEQAHDQQIELNRPFGGGTTFIATSTLFNGIASTVPNAVRVYDTSYDVSFTSEVWGVQANMVFDTAVPGEGFKHQPVLGARLVSFQEHMTQIGVSSTAANFITEINSDSRNYVYGVNLGWEMSLVHRWFTLGVRPQATLGLNTYQSKVTTNRWVSETDPLHRFELEENTFGAMIDITTYLRVPVTENFSLHAGYNLLYLFNVQRPHTQIVYDTDAVGQVPISSNFRAVEKHEDVLLNGLSFGGEWIFR